MRGKRGDERQGREMRGKDGRWEVRTGDERVHYPTPKSIACNECAIKFPKGKKNPVGVVEKNCLPNSVLQRVEVPTSHLPSLPLISPPYLSSPVPTSYFPSLPLISRPYLSSPVPIFTRFVNKSAFFQLFYLRLTNYFLTILYSHCHPLRIQCSILLGSLSLFTIIYPFFWLHGRYEWIYHNFRDSKSVVVRRNKWWSQRSCHILVY